jgi:hypothetical protein
MGDLSGKDPKLLARVGPGMQFAPAAIGYESEEAHRGADQWLYVIAGTGSALVKKKRYKLAEMNNAPGGVS